jgi:outer membrane beta-barrel protein
MTASSSPRSRTVAALTSAAALTAMVAVPHTARADRREALADQPAVRHRLLLVAKRLEATPMFESTINADFRHFVGGGLKLEYHVNDMLSFGGIGVFSAALDTKLTTRVIDTLEPTNDDNTREPSQDEFAQHLNKMPIHGAIFVSVTPWYGKVAAFGKAFVNFDFYFQGGASFAQLTSDCKSNVCDDMEPGVGLPDPDGTGPLTAMPDDNPNDDPPLNSGFKPGLYLGGGLHVFVSDFIAIDLSIRDYAFVDNPSGADFNADLAVKDDDSRFLHHLYTGVGVSILLPLQVKRTR